MSLNLFKKVLVVSLALFTIFFGWFFLKSFIKPNFLISSLFQRDFTDKISTKISSGYDLNFQNSKELETLSTIPRYLVYNSKTKKVYYSKAADQKLSPASFTKLLSMQVALDFVSIGQSITVHSESLNKVPTILGLKAGEVFKVEDLLRGAIATSANDAAQVVVDESARSINMYNQEFIYYMNKKATLIGMSHSHFSNVDGLDEQSQYSTLTDLAKLVNNVQVYYPEIIKAGNSDNVDIASESAHGYYYLPNWNGLLGVYSGVNGLKIAYTENAGYSTIVTYNKNDLNLVAIVSGTNSILERDRAAADLLDAALIREGQKPARIGKDKLNLKYKVWGDLARKIKAELKAIEQKNKNESF